jgi:succinylglutamate desuccinylase
MKIIANSKWFRLALSDSGKPGPTVCIVGGVHGDETCGPSSIAALERRFLAGDRLLCGQLLTLLANEEAVRSKRRFVDFDLNRAFGNSNAFGHESQLAPRLAPYLTGMNYVLDLHSTSAPTQPFFAGALTKRHLEMFKMTGLEVYTHGWEIHRGYTMLIDEVNRLDGVGAIVECGKTGDSQTDKVAYTTVLHFLQELEMLSPAKSQSLKSHIVVRIDQTVRARTENFFFTRNFKNLAPVDAGEVVAYDDGKPITHPHAFVIAMPTQGKLQAGDEAFGVGIIEETFSA